MQANVVSLKKTGLLSLVIAALLTTGVVENQVDFCRANVKWLALGEDGPEWMEKLYVALLNDTNDKSIPTLLSGGFAIPKCRGFDILARC